MVSADGLLGKEAKISLEQLRTQLAEKWEKPCFKVSAPLSSPAASLQGSELRCSLRTKKGKDREAPRIGFSALHQIKSATSLCCVLDMQNAFPRQVLQDCQGRGLIHKRIFPCAEVNVTLAAKGASCRLGAASDRKELGNFPRPCRTCRSTVAKGLSQDF